MENQIFAQSSWQAVCRTGAIILLLASALTTKANPLTREQAQQRAQAFLQNKKGARQLTPVRSGARLAPRYTQPATGTDLYYVFDRGTDEGFVIVSGDDQTPAVLGYTDSGSFDYSKIPDNMREWLDDYAGQIAAVQKAGYTAGELPVADLVAHDPIDQLMNSKWNQGNPYYLLCPNYFNTGLSVTGCVATAMAQILYYHRANSPKEILEDIPDYTVGNSHATYGDLNVKGYPAGSPIDWDNMQPTYNSSSTAIQKHAVAQLMSYCGTAVRMMYSSGSSGAYSTDVPDALKKYFGYPSSCRHISRSDMTEEKFDETVYAEIAKGDPVYLSGSNGSGGHAFVCDGYDGDLCYHINWGWGGSSDGFYMLAKLNPGSQGIGGSDGGYSGGQAAVIGIHMDNWGEKAMTISNARARQICIANWDTNGDNKLSYDEAAAVTDLGNAFQGATIAAFNEFYYFTGITEIPAEAFAGSSLSSIRLPKGLTSIGAHAFEGCTALRTVTTNDALSSIGDAAFKGCTKLSAIELPSGLQTIGAGAFEDCTALAELTLPTTLKAIGQRAFAGCTKLAEMTFETLLPQAVAVGSELFDGVDLSNAKLNIAQGTNSFFASTAPWSSFGNLAGQRNTTNSHVIPLTEDILVYLYNVGTGTFLTHGEVKDTQGTVGTEPMRFKLGRTTSMPEDVYYLYSKETGSATTYYYRSSSNSDVGSGVKATFVDGARSCLTDKSGWWKIQQVADGIYTLQTPAEASGYVEGEYLGALSDHASNYAVPTAGAYSDVSYADHPLNCQWMMIAYDEDFAATSAAAQVLGNLLRIADGAPINVSIEQAVYNNFDATLDEIVEAQDRLRKRLGIITFADDAVRDVCLNYWDLDGDGEMTPYEISGIPNINLRFQNCKMVTFDEFQYFTGCTTISYRAFGSCTKLQSIILPKNIVSIGTSAFQNCSALKEIELPAYIAEIGATAFTGCKALETVRLHVINPEYISLSTDAFQNIDLSKATLYVPMGTSQLYAEADVWKDFGTIKEMRSATQPKFSEFKANEEGYVYNIGSRKYISRGEAYGTQAVVAQQGMVYQFKRATVSGKTCYYLYSEETGKDNKNLFRSEEDSKVGKGIRTCFVDGGSNRLTDRSAYWNIEYVEGTDHYFTMQVPSSFTEYVEGEYLGTDLNHATSAVSGSTQGLYWDVVREDNEANCLWAWVSMADVEAAQQFDEDVALLKRYIQLAGERSIDATAEQAVYDNFNASAEEIRTAVDALREKLHFVRFDSKAVKQLCVNNWDTDCDGELSYAEAAAIQDIAEVFRAQTDFTSLEELQFFTGLTEIPASAFRNSSQMISLYIPAHVSAIGDKAFTSCSKLKYVAILNPSTTPVEASSSNLSSSTMVFVPKAALEAYRADEFWSRFNLQEYTGVPTVTPDTLTRAYGSSNARLTFNVTGAPVNGTPALSCEATAASPVGDYDIAIEAGSITSKGLLLQTGVYHVEPAVLTATAQSYTREIGEENPTFEITIKGFRNKETEDILTEQPKAECDATVDSPWGDYEIRIVGGEAPNYVFEYVSGTLTINPPVGISTPADPSKPVTTYDLSGRRATKTKHGLHITEGKKVIIR